MQAVTNTRKVCTIYFARPGATEDNNGGRWSCADETPLSESGKSNAYAIRELFKDAIFNCIYTSKAKRTIETANIIVYGTSEEPSDGKIIPARRKNKFYEMRIGEFEGKTNKEIIELFCNKTGYNDIATKENLSKVWAKYNGDPILKGNDCLLDNWDPENYDTFDGFAEKSIRRTRRIASRHLGETLLIVPHGTPMKAVIAAAYGVTADRVEIGKGGSFIAQFDSEGNITILKESMKEIKILRCKELDDELIALEADSLSPAHQEKFETNLEIFRKRICSESPIDIQIRTDVLSSLYHQRNGNQDLAQHYLENALEHLREYSSEDDLSERQKEALSSALNLMATSVAYRLGSSVYDKTIEAMAKSNLNSPSLLIAQANALLNKCDLNKALEMIHMAKNKMEEISSDENRADLINVLAAIYMFQGKCKEALELIEEACSQLSKMSIRLIVNLKRKAADIHMMSGNFISAKANLSQALEVFDSYVDKHLEFTTKIREGILLSREGSGRQAIHTFAELRTLLPQPNRQQLALLIGNIGLTLERIHDKESIVLEDILLNTARELDPIPINQDDLALDFVERAFKIHSGTPIYYLILAQNLIEMYRSREMDAKAKELELSLSSFHETMFEQGLPTDHKAPLYGWDIL